MLPYDSAKRVQLALEALRKIYPDVDIASHIIGDPITIISREADPYFQGAFKEPHHLLHHRGREADPYFQGAFKATILQRI